MPHAIQAGVAATHESVYRFVCFGTVRTHCDKGGTTTAAVTERRWIAHSDAMPRQKGPRAR